MGALRLWSSHWVSSSSTCSGVSLRPMSDGCGMAGAGHCAMVSALAAVHGWPCGPGPCWAVAPSAASPRAAPLRRTPGAGRLACLTALPWSAAEAVVTGPAELHAGDGHGRSCGPVAEAVAVVGAAASLIHGATVALLLRLSTRFHHAPCATRRHARQAGRTGHHGPGRWPAHRMAARRATRTGRAR